MDYNDDNDEPIVISKTPPPPAPEISVATSNAKPTDNAANIAVHKAH